MVKTANIYKIQKYSIHDGPGIRTTIFFKGCPLSCLWCHNPESQRSENEFFYFKEKCVRCGSCVRECPAGALTLENGGLKRSEKCHFCGKCARICDADAIELVGRRMSLKETVDEIEKDRVFYDQSGGGVTFSGGEPLMQFEFVNTLARTVKKLGIHTTLDTCGYAKWEQFEDIAQNIDLFLYDIKIMDPAKHLEYTGVGNELILENLSKLTEKHGNVNVRIPIVAGINDDEKNMEKTADFLSNLGISNVHLLAYHKTGIGKYERLGRDYKLHHVKPLSSGKIEKLVTLLSSKGVNANCSGLPDPEDN